jgi:Fe-S cluster biogenesis protein NfuA/nitrite reductase/ring-hydroxylating ferredoxin subunit
MQPTAIDPRVTSQRLEALLGDIGASSDPRMADAAEELVRLLMQLYGAGLQRILEIAARPDTGVPLAERLTHDDLVASLLVLHDLHPLDVATRVSRAIDKVRPYLGSHGGGVEVVAIEGDVVRLRMEGSCSSCPSSSVTLNYALERAILDAAPEIARVEAIDDGHSAAHGDAHGAPVNLIQIGGAVPAARAPEWTPLTISPVATNGELTAVDASGLSLLVAGLDGTLYAYRNVCARCGAALAAGRLDGQVLACPSCAARFDLRLAGRSADGDALHLDPLPLIVDAGQVQVALPVAAV